MLLREVLANTQGKAHESTSSITTIDKREREHLSNKLAA